MARKSRKETAVIPTPEVNSTCRAGIYVRLSYDNKHSHTVSIETQQLIIFGAAAIARDLFARGIPTPGEYKAAHGKLYHDVSRTHGRWSNSTVLRILEDERYIGSYVIGKRAVIEVGGTRSRRKDRDEWFIIPDHHPAIIEKELFEQVQSVQRRFSLSVKKNKRLPVERENHLWVL